MFKKSAKSKYLEEIIVVTTETKTIVEE